MMHDEDLQLSDQQPSEEIPHSTHTAKYPTLLLITGVQTKSLYSHRVAGMTKFKEGDHTKCWWGCGASRALGIVYRSTGLVLPVLQWFCWDMTSRQWLCQGSASWVWETSTASMHSISIPLLSLKSSSFSNPRPNRQLICPTSVLPIPGVPVSGVSVWHLVANSLRVVGVCMYP